MRTKPLVDFRMRKSTKGRIKPYGYNCIQPISGLLSLTSQLKSGRDNVFEFKLNGTAEEALQQINDKGYAKPFQTDNRQVMKVGVEFSTETRNVSRWLIEE